MVLVNSNVVAPLNLTAKENNTSIALNWTAVTDATGYSVKRSISTGGPYETIASNVSGNTYIDADVTSGITYNYVVTAINANGESGPSNEASASLASGRTILTIYVSGGQIKEYDLAATELNNFLSWYDAKDSGTGPARYAFFKTWNKGPFKARTEYVIFDKILTFDVDEYDPVQ